MESLVYDVHSLITCTYILTATEVLSSETCKGSNLCPYEYNTTKLPSFGYFQGIHLCTPKLPYNAFDTDVVGPDKLPKIVDGNAAFVQPYCLRLARLLNNTQTFVDLFHHDIILPVMYGDYVHCKKPFTYPHDVDPLGNSKIDLLPTKFLYDVDCDAKPNPNCVVAHVGSMDIVKFSNCTATCRQVIIRRVHVSFLTGLFDDMKAFFYQLLLDLEYILGLVLSQVLEVVAKLLLPPLLSLLDYIWGIIMRYRILDFAILFLIFRQALSVTVSTFLVIMLALTLHRGHIVDTVN